MACCLGGIFRPLIIDPCTGDTRLLRDGERLRIGDSIVGTTSSSYITITTTTTLTDEAAVFADASSGALTVYLPPGSEGMRCSVKKIDATGNVVTVDGDGSETIDGQLTASIGVQYTNLTFLFHDGEWWIM